MKLELLKNDQFVVTMLLINHQFLVCQQWPLTDRLPRLATPAATLA